MEAEDFNFLTDDDLIKDLQRKRLEFNICELILEKYETYLYVECISKEQFKEDLLLFSKDRTSWTPTNKCKELLKTYANNTLDALESIFKKDISSYKQFCDNDLLSKDDDQFLKLIDGLNESCLAYLASVKNYIKLLEKLFKMKTTDAPEAYKNHINAMKSMVELLVWRRNYLEAYAYNKHIPNATTAYEELLEYVKETIQDFKKKIEYC